MSTSKPKIWLSRRQQAARYSVDVRTITRWGADPGMNMPGEADFRGSPRRADDELEAWERWRVSIRAERKAERAA